MNIEEIKKHILMLCSDGKQIRPPYYMIEEAVKITMDKSDLDVYKLNYCDLHLYRVVSYIEAVINHLGLQYDYAKLDNDKVDAYALYEDFIQIYEMKEIDTWTFDDLIEKHISMAEKEYLQLGMLEHRLIGVAEKLTNITDVFTDDKKLDKKLKIVKKHFPNFDTVVSELINKTKGLFVKNIKDMEK